ncbi:MAG: VOC family protein [Vicinamibacterales bacterium]
MEFRNGIVLATLAIISAAPQSRAQAPPPAAASRAVGVSMLHLNVTNLDRSLTLYKDVLGMELIEPVAPPRAGGGLVSEPGAMLQTAQLRVPGGAFEMELVEWSGIPLRAVEPRIQDPGEVMLAFGVRNLDARLAGAKRLGLSIITKNGEPYLSDGRGGPNRAVMLRDPSGFIVELTDVTPNPATAASALPGPITSVSVSITVQDLAQTVNFYNQAFGFDMAAPALASPANDRIKALFNDPSIATTRATRGTFPGSDFTINFQEFSGPARKPARHRVQDPGGPILLVQVQNFRAAIDAIKANGGIIGQGQTSVALPLGVTGAWTRDPNGMLLLVSGPATPRGGNRQ